MSELAALLDLALEQNQLSLSEDHQNRLLEYLYLMQTWNKVFNLTTITNQKDMIYLHLIDSLILTPYLHGHNMLDVGTGAGLPGIPLAITQPAQQWTLLDKSSKKTRFLIQVVAELKLTNIKIHHDRCEDFHPAQGFDSIISRAFGSINMFATKTLHLLEDDGKLLAMKGKYPLEELTEIPDAFQLIDVVPLHIKGVTIERHLVRLGLKKGGK